MMKPIITLVVAVLAVFSGMASETLRHQTYMFDASGRKTYYSYDGDGKSVVEAPASEFALPMRGKKKVEIATLGEPKLLDIELVYDEKEYVLKGLLGGDMSTSAYWYRDNPEKKLGIQEIPAGIAGLICVLQRQDPETKESYHYVIAKDISKLENGAKLVFDVADCIHQIEYAPVDEDGEEFNLATYKGGEMVKSGKYESLSSIFVYGNVMDGIMFVDHRYYMKQIISDGAGGEREVYGRPRYVCFNDGGPDFMVGCFIVGHPLVDLNNQTVIEMPVYQGTYSTEPSEIIMRNNPSLFQTYKSKWTRSPYSIATYSTLKYGLQLAYEINNTTPVGLISMVDWEVGTDSNVETELKVCSNPSYGEGDNVISMVLQEIFPEDNIDVRNGLSKWWFKTGKNGREYIPHNCNGEQGWATGFSPLNWMNNYYFVEDNYNEWLYSYGKPNPHLVYEDSKALGRLGNNCPIISIMPGIWLPMGSDMTLFNYGLVGRYGEGNIAAIELIEQTGTDEYDEEGFRKEFFSYENVLIDGEVDGRVDVEMSIKQGEEDDDFFPPMLTHLLTRNTEGYLTDRFENASEGVVEFYAGDFYHNFDWSLAEYGFYEYKCRQLTEDRVKVEYAPYGTDNFAELMVTEVPEKYFYPAYGNYFTVPLKDVDAESPNGWYDMRITLEDETGNKHVQTISPVFKLLDGAGLEEIAAGAEMKKPLYFNLMGQPVRNPENGVFIEYDGKKARKVRR